MDIIIHPAIHFTFRIIAACRLGPKGYFIFSKGKPNFIPLLMQTLSHSLSIKLPKLFMWSEYKFLWTHVLFVALNINCRKKKLVTA